jgi:hypothetical protein
MIVLMSQLGYPPRVLARMQRMTPNEYYAAVAAEGSRKALLIKWVQEHPQMGYQQLPLLLHVHQYAGGAPGRMSGPGRWHCSNDWQQPPSNQQ